VDKRERGRWAEDAAAVYLAGRGHRIVGRNVRLQRGELDLITSRDGHLWFVECKSRGRRDRGPPHRAVDARKRRALFAAAREYALRERWAGDYGFLVVSVVPSAEDGRPCVSCGFLSIIPGDGAGAS